MFQGQLLDGAFQKTVCCPIVIKAYIKVYIKVLGIDRREGNAGHAVAALAQQLHACRPELEQNAAHVVHPAQACLAGQLGCSNHTQS